MLRDRSFRSSGRLCGLSLPVRLLAVVVLIGVLAPAGRADDVSADGVWRAVDRAAARHVDGEPWVRPNRFQGALLDNAVLAELLSSAPLEDTREGDTHPLLISLPTPEGTFARFYIVESPVMEPGLAAEFPEIKTYRGQGLDDPTATVRLDTTPLGFHAQVLSPCGNYYIDPYTKGDNDFYASYFKRDLTDIHHFACLPAGDDEHARLPALPDDGDLRSSGGTRRTYRLANACTGEYAAYFGGTVALAQAAIVTAINRVTGVYETECAIRLTLIANNTSIVYTSAAADPYTNDDGYTMLSENISNCNSVIGSANYDIGHVFSTGGGGIAYLGAVCSTYSKAGGVTGSSSPVGDAYYIDYVAHEMGHQFGANHNFNGTAGSCGGSNRNAATAYEPGSGSTIMSYAGICSGDNLQAHSDAYFSADSYREIMAYVAGSGACSTNTSTGNNPPTVNAGANYTIPKQTPFQLTATGSDPDGDAITYFWEERDLGAAQSASGGIIADNGTSPFIRPWTPTTDPSRIVPRLSNLLANTLAFGEQLPNTSRTVNFRCTARDNRSGNGGVNYDDMVITVTNGAGPFQVTSPNTAVSWSGTQTVTWNVASTNSSPVSCANVRILLSTDGGNTWPTVLLASTPNDGTQAVTLPNINTTTARIRVEAVNNIFFDISNVNFTITPAGTPATITVEPSNQTVCAGGSASFSVTATGTPAPTYRWRKGTTELSNGGNISGATTNTLTINPVGVGDAAANYNCVATNIYGSDTSNDASLTVRVAPTITDQPESQTLVVGGAANFSVTATGSATLGYRWRKGGVPLSDGGNILGALTPDLSISPLTAGDAGEYDVVVTNSCGSDTSDPAGLWRIGDFNHDGDIDADDATFFVDCLLGPHVPCTTQCKPADFDGDNDVDLADFAIFANLVGEA